MLLKLSVIKLNTWRSADCHIIFIAYCYKHLKVIPIKFWVVYILFKKNTKAFCAGRINYPERHWYYTTHFFSLFWSIISDANEPFASSPYILEDWSYVFTGPVVAALTSRATNYNPFKSGRLCMWPHKSHIQIVDITRDWFYPRKNLEKLYDPVIMRSRVTAPLETFFET